MDAVNKLIDHMFVNDVPELKSGGKLVMLTFTAAARMVGSYNQMVKILERTIH